MRRYFVFHLSYYAIYLGFSLRGIYPVKCIDKYTRYRCCLSPLLSGDESCDKRQCRTTLPKIIHLSAWYLPSEKHREWERKEGKRARDTSGAKEGLVVLPTSQSHTRVHVGRRETSFTLVNRHAVTYRTRICIFRKTRANSRLNYTVRP